MNLPHQNKKKRRYDFTNRSLATRFCALCGTERYVKGGKFMTHPNNRLGLEVCPNSGEPAASASGNMVLRNE